MRAFWAFDDDGPASGVDERVVPDGCSEIRVVFEDPGREFPRRILYWREGESLMARIEGRILGQQRSREWRFERMRAPL